MQMRILIPPVVSSVSEMVLGPSTLHPLLFALSPSVLCFIFTPGTSIHVLTTSFSCFCLLQAGAWAPPAFPSALSPALAVGDA